ncbi:hypothetical protein [Pseudogulbenkiania subflava]|uniref:hypothetical protein n=1 Tax=Pseudogulbenkiania subflava TaxID=451637 RepID=UPI001179ACB3|nr:hypothetical protein [Pseudogulbenkiania subflava]
MTVMLAARVPRRTPALAFEFDRCATARVARHHSKKRHPWQRAGRQRLAEAGRRVLAHLLYR